MRPRTDDWYDGDEPDDLENVTDRVQDVSSNHEDRVLTRCDVRHVLRRLPRVERAVVALMQRYTVPPGYYGPWPATAWHVGEYLRVTFAEFGGRRVPARTVGHLNQRALRRMARWLTRGEGRR
jgi:hypothetical protein